MHGARIRAAAGAALACALVFGNLVASPSAQAAITGSQITAPADPSFLVADETATTSPTFTVSGLTAGGNRTAAKVDVRCYYGGTSVLLAKSAALTADGSFTIPDADLDKLLDLTCRLRAVPAGSNPADLTPYSGPLIGVGERDSSTVGGGPNNGKLYDYYLYGPGQTAAFDYVSLGGCGLKGGYLLDPTYAVTTSTFFCNAGLFRGESGSKSTRSELQIDGANAYAPEEAESIAANAAGLPTLSYSYTVDAHTGDLVIHETDPLVTCPAATYPPTAASCGSFVSAGVTDSRTITQNHDGHVSWITDVFTSTDGKQHTLDLLWDNSQHFSSSGGGDSSLVEYDFPGQTGFSTHAAGDVVPLQASSPGTILVQVHGAADGSTSTGRGAIVYDRPASGAKFTDVATPASELTLHQTGLVPAGGSTRFRFAYVQDFKADEVGSLAQAASAAFVNTLAVKRSGKGRGTVRSAPGGILCGKTCSHGYAYGTSVTLSAVAARGSTFTGWSGPCKGHGFCTVTTEADAAVKATFSLRRCVVPNVVGKTLKAARRALTRAYCSVGKIGRAPSSRIAKGHVVSQTPTRGKRLRARTRVRLVVSTG